nr:MAG TPA: hypothetical protein [Caudoviricetes sp.]
MKNNRNIPATVQINNKTVPVNFKISFNMIVFIMNLW